MTGSCEAEVLGQRDAVIAEALPHLAQRGDVGPPEAVDRLLGVAHDEQLPGDNGSTLLQSAPWSSSGVAGEQEGNLRLDGVGVLELVDEDVREAALEVAAAAGVVAEEIAGPDEQVVELGPPLAAAALGVVGDEAAHLLRERRAAPPPAPRQAHRRGPPPIPGEGP